MTMQFTDPRLEQMYPTQTGSQYFSYTIQPGDTLSQIAARFGVSINDLASLNGIADPNMIYAGRMLQIPYTGVDTGQAAVPEVTGGGGITPYTPPTTTGIPAYPTTGVGGGLTLNPDVATVDRLRSVLQQMGWGGDYSNVQAMVNAYNQAWMQSPEYTGGTAGGMLGDINITGPNLEWGVRWQIAQLEDAIAKAQLAFNERRFEEYEMALIDIQRQEQELNRIVTMAGMTGYLEGQPTLQREQWTQQYDEAIRQFDEQIALTKQQAEEARRQYNETLAWQKDQEANRLQLQRDQLALQRETATGYVGGQPTVEMLMAQANIAMQQGQLELAQQYYNLAQEAQMGYGAGGAPTLEREIATGQLTGFMGGQPTIEMAQLMGEPRNLAQTLILLGYTPEQAAAWLEGTPTVQNLMGQPGVSFPGGVTPEGRNPLFPFITGRQLPVRETLSQIQSGSPQIPLITGMASLSGQTPESFWGEFEKYLPKGTRNPLTRFM